MGQSTVEIHTPNLERSLSEASSENWRKIDKKISTLYQ